MFVFIVIFIFIFTSIFSSVWPVPELESVLPSPYLYQCQCLFPFLFACSCPSWWQWSFPCLCQLHISSIRVFQKKIKGGEVGTGWVDGRVGSFSISTVGTQSGISIHSSIHLFIHSLFAFTHFDQFYHDSAHLRPFTHRAKAATERVAEVNGRFGQFPHLRVRTRAISGSGR